MPETITAIRPCVRIVNDHKDVAELLLANGADVNAKSHKGTSRAMAVAVASADKFGVDARQLEMDTVARRVV